MERQGVCEKDGGGECHFILLFYIKAEMRLEIGKCYLFLHRAHPYEELAYEAYKMEYF